jgi:hypothetical protein
MPLFVAVCILHSVQIELMERHIHNFCIPHSTVKFVFSSILEIVEVCKDEPDMRRVEFVVIKSCSDYGRCLNCCRSHISAPP